MLDSYQKRADITEIVFLLNAVFVQVLQLLPSCVSCVLLDDLAPHDAHSTRGAVKAHLKRLLGMPDQSEEAETIEAEVRSLLCKVSKFTPHVRHLTHLVQLRDKGRLKTYR